MPRSNGSVIPTETADDVDAVLAASRALVAVASRSLAPTEDVVSLSQWRALVVVADAPGVSLNQLAEGLGVHASTATRVCDRLIAAGLLVREPHSQDRRYLALSLTRKGQRLFDKVMAARAREISSILDQLSPISRRRIATAFREFAEAAGETPTGAGRQLSI
jgi:DNA-binding MarR family transcriptional regulator